MSDDQIIIAVIFGIACILAATTGYCGTGYFRMKRELATRRQPMRPFTEPLDLKSPETARIHNRLVEVFPQLSHRLFSVRMQIAQIIATSKPFEEVSGLESSSEHPAKHEQTK